MLSNPLIEYILDLKTKGTGNFSYINCFFGIQCDKSLFPLLDFETEYCILPCHKGSLHAGHWTLIIINIIKKEFNFFDSAKKVADQKATTDNAFKNFSRFLKMYGELGKASDYTVIHHSYKKQTDSFNCGIFLLYFVDVFMGQDESYETLCPKSYRQDLKVYTVKSSEDLKNICRKCFKKDNGQ